jgi:hypothetical protein
MQKKYLLLSIFLLFGCNQVEKKIPLEWEEGQFIKGNVKSIKETNYEAEEKFGEVSKGKFNNQFFVQFNEGGKMSELISQDFAGKIQNKIIVVFDKKGNNIERNIYNSDGNLKEQMLNEFDEKDNNIVSEKMIEGKLYEKFLTKFNNENKEIEEIEYNRRGEITGKYTYEYDVKGNRTKVTNYDRDLVLRREYTYEYDTNDNNVKAIFSQKDVDWDVAGLPYTGTKTITQMDNKHDKFGNLIEVKRTKNSEGQEYKETITLKYKLDEKGNYIERIIYRDGKASKISEREITYYDKKFW